MSRWSISAISPRCSDLTSTLVRRPERTGPLTVLAGRGTSVPRSSGARETGLRRCAGAAAGSALIAASRLACVAAIAARVTPRRAERTPEPSGCFAQLARVSARGAVARVGPEHAHQLADDLALRELHHRRACGRDRGVLDDGEVTLRQRGDLGQVRDAQELSLSRQLA